MVYGLSLAANGADDKRSLGFREMNLKFEC